MKKFLCLAAACMMAVSLTGCGSKDEGSESTLETVMLTDKGNIDDKSFNQGTYEGIKAFYGAENEKKTFDYIKPVDATTDEYKNAIDQAVKKGAKTIVTPGFLFESAIYEKQTQYPDVNFILIDGYPNNGLEGDEYKDDVQKNTVGIKFKEEQVGYLAGYAAVKETAADGKAKIAFLGGQAVPAVVNYGYGYLQGADDAAKELNVQVEAKYYYSDGFAATPEAQTLAAGWYKDGVSIIFGCGGSIGNSAMAAAEASDPKGKVIGVDVDQSGESETVVISARKGLATAVQKELQNIKDGKFEGGKKLVLGAAEDSVDLSMDTSKLEKFTKEDYDALYAKIKNGEIEIFDYTKTSETKNKNVTDLTFDHVKVDFIAK